MLDSRDLGRIGKMELKFGLGVVLGVVSVALVLVHWFIPGTRQELPYASAVFAGAVAIFAAYYGRAALISRIQVDRLRRTFEIMDRFNSPDLARVRRCVVREIDHKSKSKKDIFEQVSDNLDLDIQVTQLLGLFEDMSIAIQVGYTDEDVLFKALAGPVVQTWDRLAGFVEELRMKRGRTTLYMHFERLAHAWSEEKSFGTPGQALSHSFDTQKKLTRR